jgi:aryl-alcohol dehydrogenase-like predicted oxidoreductase
MRLGMSGDALQSEPAIALADELNIAPLGVGAWAWGTTRLWGYGKEYDRSDVGRVFRASMAEGVTLVDTAEMYANGASERIIGEILREGSFEGTPVIATKFAPLPYRFSARSLLSAVDKSLERLGIETIDLYQIHFPSAILKINALMDALAETVKAGKVRRVGVSNYGADQMQRAHERLAYRSPHSDSKRLRRQGRARRDEWSRASSDGSRVRSWTELRRTHNSTI